VALLHGLGTGSDVKSAWLLVLSLLCLAAVLATVLWRAITAWGQYAGRGRFALAGAGAFTLFLVLWLPGGPLGSEWARRSGTPSALLGATRSGKHSAPPGHARPANGGDGNRR
jgi:hypothetical protein